MCYLWQSYKHSKLYAITTDTKEQITTLCAISASGECLPPMHIFPGTRFKYNPMLNSVDGAYFGHSLTGWISTVRFDCQSLCQTCDYLACCFAC